MRLRAFLSVGAIAFGGLIACTSSDYVNLVNDQHDPVFKRVNTPEKAADFYKNKTYFAVVTKVVGPNGQSLQPELELSQVSVQPVGYNAEYYAPDGTAYLAVAGETNVRLGRWTIDQFGRAYPRICTNFPTMTAETQCKWPSSHLGKNSQANLYQGDVLALRDQRFPQGTRNVNLEGSSRSILSALGAGAPTPIKASR